MWALGLMFAIMGSMLLTGEYLCVEVAWRCVDYNQFYTGLGASLLGTGLVTTLIGTKND